MSSCPTAATSTTVSSTSSPSPTEPGEGRLPLVIACGALTAELRRAAARRGWQLEIRSLPAQLHNRPERIADALEALAGPARAGGRPVVLAYGDCGSYGEIDALADRIGLARLEGLHCYDVYASPAAVRRLFADEPGTYLLTDFLIAGFERLVVEPLGLDRHPELWRDYFAHYRRVVWLAQRRSEETEQAAGEIAARLGLPLEVLETGVDRLERELERSLSRARAIVQADAASTGCR